MWSVLRNGIFPRSRSLDDAVRPTPNESQELAESNLEKLVRICNRYVSSSSYVHGYPNLQKSYSCENLQDVGNTFQGLQQYIQSLRQVIHLQREQIQRLEQQLCKGTFSAAFAAGPRVVAAPVKGV